MGDFRELCAELVEYLALLDEPPHEMVCRARAALSAAPPEPVGEGEVADETRYLVKELRDQADDLSPSLELFGLIHRAADLLEQRHPAPVAVSERLPGAGDCDEKGSCWLWTADDVDGVGHWSYSHRDWAMEGDVTHWLPAHALPLPQPADAGEVGP